jgi:Fe-S oxidoreductase/nitrate reductase gamma subunit
MNELSTNEASREILWNVGTLTNTILMYLIFAITAGIALIGILRRIELWRNGKKHSAQAPSLIAGINNFVSWVLLQKGTLKEKKPGISHHLIFIGFIVLTITTTAVMIDHDFGIKIYRGNFYLLLTVLSDVLGLGLLLGLGVMAKRRYLDKPDQLHTAGSDKIFLIFLALLVVQGFILEGIRIKVTKDPWSHWSPVGWLFAQFFWSFSNDSVRLIHYITWWWHAITFFLLLAILPYSKFFHVLASSANLYFGRMQREKGALPNPGDLEKLMETQDEFSIGIQTIKDYSWKQLLELDACTSCGRCQSVCPAYNTGKPLSPKWLILDTRNHALALNTEDKIQNKKSFVPKSLAQVDKVLMKDFFFPSINLIKDQEKGSYHNNGSYRGGNTAIHETSLELGLSAEQRISGEVMSPDVFWSCTTCMACVEACPVGINHVDQIVENRRNMVLMHGEIPSEAQNTIRALENRANPYGAPEDRIKWLQDLDVKILKPGDSVDYLYWVGCVSAYDPRKQKIARALTNIMKKSGLSFGILGTAEGCTGDPARRLGEENLFQTLAKSNIETLKSIRFKYLVANCPHCFNTIKNEYPQFGNLQNGEQAKIIHHSQLLKRLLKENKIPLKNNNIMETVTFHDPCYLGRYNDEYDAPRDALVKIGVRKVVEMEASKTKAMCCGAGGGHFWMDLKQGERVNVVRMDQAAETGADTVATACPFCMQMMEDGAKLTGREETHKIKDIAELVAEQME